MDTMKINPYHITDVAELTIGGDARVVTGDGAPTSVVPGFVGQIYINTTGDDIYMAYGTGAGEFKMITT